VYGVYKNLFECQSAYTNRPGQSRQRTLMHFVPHLLVTSSSAIAERPRSRVG